MNKGVITCPKCKMRVFPRQDGTCPSCQAVISSEKSRVKQKPSDSHIHVHAKSREISKSKDLIAPRKSAAIEKPSKPKVFKNQSSNKDIVIEANPTPIIQEIPMQRNIENRVSSAIFCQSCGREAQTKYVEYYQNIGVLVMRFSKEVKGHFCKDCSNKYFWTFTGTTLFLGWWGVISFIVTLFILPNNIIRYLGTLRLDSPTSAPQPPLTDTVIEKIKPYVAELFERVNAGEEMEVVARSVAKRANTSPGQVIAFAFALAQVLKEKKD